MVTTRPDPGSTALARARRAASLARARALEHELQVLPGAQAPHHDPGGV
jgi:hypothetical protein